MVRFSDESAGEREYTRDPRGHTWMVNGDGEINIFAFEHGWHNGPACVVCGYGFCHHCRSGPEVDCPTPATQYLRRQN